jgi:hypothetical protein
MTKIDTALAANTQITLGTALGFMHAVNPNYDFVEAVVRTLYAVGPSQWEAPDWLLAQICVETTNATVELATRFNNFGGIGVNGTTSPNPQNKKPTSPSDGSNDWLWVNYHGKVQWVMGLSKPNPVEGAEMFIGHRKAFTDLNWNTWANNRDPRYTAARLNRVGHDWPVAKDITYFGSGKWAEDTTGYGAKCIAKFEEIKAWKKA